MLTPGDFFNLAQATHAAAFKGAAYCWDPLKTLGDYVQLMLGTESYAPGIHPEALIHPGAVVNEKLVHIGAGARVQPGAYIEGPAIISAGATVGQGAYVRAGVVASPGSIIGHATEAKNALFMEDAHAPHFAYVGDSILGRGVNLGAGTKLANLPVNSEKDPDTGERPSVVIYVQDTPYDTGLAKLGAIIGDGTSLGCNTVTNPGALIGAGCLVYTLAMVRKGYIPPNHVVKVRQSQQIIARR